MADRLRVAVVARAVMPLHGYGGLERSVHDLVRHLAARGVEVTLVTPPSQSPPGTLGVPGVRLRPVPYISFPFANRRGTTILDRSTAYLWFGRRAGRVVRSLAADGSVAIVHGFGASVLGYATSKRPAPLVFNPQGLEEFGATASAQPWAKRVGYTPLRRAVLRCAEAADVIIATDRSLEPTVERHLHPRAGQVRTIPNGLDVALADSAAGPDEGRAMRARFGIEPGEIVFLSVGRLEANKGFDVLAAALGRASQRGRPLATRPWRWVIVGTGPFKPDIDDAISLAEIGAHVIFPGRVPDAALHAWYEAATCFVHPTRYEGSSLVTLEAMAHRKPIVATRAGGLPDKVRPGLNGWLVEPGDVDGLSAALADAVIDPARLSAMGAASRTIVEREFSWDTLADQYLRLYDELLSRKK
jgi:glycogen synthase